MKIAVLGTGSVGATIGSKLIELGHEVKMGSRTATNEKAVEWANKNGAAASAGTFANAAAFGQLVFNCTKGMATLDILAMCGEDNLNGKILVDVSNPLDASQGGLPTLAVCNTDSLGEQIQKTYPQVKVVKSLNTMWCGIMVNPRMLPQTHQVYISGNDPEAKTTVKNLLNSFGWMDEEILDLGDISTSRGPEMILPLWLRIYSATQNGAFNLKIVR
jgi:8-hydroxy-5-deazaflavin:NADPH oxidoreductase